MQHVKPMPAVPAAAPVPPPHPSYPPNGYGAAPPPPMPQQSYQPPPRPYGGPAAPPASSDPRLNSYRPPPPGPPPPGHGPGGYGAPPAQGGLTPEVQAMLSTLPEDQRVSLLTPLPPPFRLTPLRAQKIFALTSTAADNPGVGPANDARPDQFTRPNATPERHAASEPSCTPSDICP